MNADTTHPILTLSVKLAADTGENILVDESGAIVAAEKNALGPTVTAGKEDEHVSVAVLGVATCVAAANVAKGDLLKAAAAGKVTKAVNSDAFGDQSYIGRALLAGKANKTLPVLLIPN